MTDEIEATPSRRGPVLGAAALVVLLALVLVPRLSGDRPAPPPPSPEPSFSPSGDPDRRFLALSGDYGSSAEGRSFRYGATLVALWPEAFDVVAVLALDAEDNPVPGVFATVADDPRSEFVMTGEPAPPLPLRIEADGQANLLVHFPESACDELPVVAFRVTVSLPSGPESQVLTVGPLDGLTEQIDTLCDRA